MSGFKLSCNLHFFQAVIFCRKVRNKTGIDVSVASYEPAASAREVKDYHVVVITNLPFFKRPEHSKEDVVQFMVR